MVQPRVTFITAGCAGQPDHERLSRWGAVQPGCIARRAPTGSNLHDRVRLHTPPVMDVTRRGAIRVPGTVPFRCAARSGAGLKTGVPCRQYRHPPSPPLTACGETHAAFDGRCIPPETGRFAALIVAFRSKYTQVFLPHAPCQPGASPISALTRVPPQAVMEVTRRGAIRVPGTVPFRCASRSGAGLKTGVPCRQYRHPPSPRSIPGQWDTVHDVSLNRLGPLGHEVLEGLAERSDEVVRAG